MRQALLALALSGVCLSQTPPAKDSAHSVKVNWVPSPTKGSSYYLYRAAGQCGTPDQTFERLTPTPIKELTYTDTKVRSGRKYCYRVSATDGKIESRPSQQIDVVIP